MGAEVYNIKIQLLANFPQLVDTPKILHYLNHKPYDGQFSHQSPLGKWFYYQFAKFASTVRLPDCVAVDSPPPPSGATDALDFLVALPEANRTRWEKKCGKLKYQSHEAAV